MYVKLLYFDCSHLFHKVFITIPTLILFLYTQTPQSPIVRPAAHDVYAMDNYPHGTNAVVAVISYTVSLLSHTTMSVCYPVFLFCLILRRKFVLSILQLGLIIHRPAVNLLSHTTLCVYCYIQHCKFNITLSACYHMQ